jgi:hypothetical protein
MAHAAPIKPIQLSEERLLSLCRKLSMIEAETSSTLIPSEN